MMEVIVRTDSEPLAMAAAIQSEIQQSTRPCPSSGSQLLSMNSANKRASAGSTRSSLAASPAQRCFCRQSVSMDCLHHLVVERTNEIGVRVALGARPAMVMALVLRQGLTLALIGIAVGLLGAMSVTQLLSKLLYGVPPTDPSPSQVPRSCCLRLPAWRAGCLRVERPGLIPCWRFGMTKHPFRAERIDCPSNAKALQ